MDYKEFKIRKKSGKMRSIVAPDKELKSFQKKRKKYYEKIFYSMLKYYKINNVFHGFIKGRNAVSGATQHIGYKTTIMMDISNFFDSITNEIVNAELLLAKQPPLFVEDRIKLFHKKGYCAQGFPSSPILCNIAIISTIKYIQNKLDIFIGKYEYALTIYADDITLSINSEEKKIWKECIKIITEELEKLGLQINEKKTRVRFAKYGARRILGVNVYDNHVQATRKTKYKVRAVKGHMRFSSEKAQILGGLRNWENCPLPKKLQNKLII